MSLYTSPPAGGVLPPDPTFAGLVTADAFAATEAGPPAHSGSFRTGHDVDVIVTRDAADTIDRQILTVIGGVIHFANPSTIDYVLIDQYSGGTIFQRFGGVDTLVTTGTHIERSKPEYGGDPVFAPSPYGTDGMRDVANPDADYDEIPDNYRFRRLTYTGPTTLARGINFPPATSADGYYEKTIRNQTGNNILVNTVGSIGLGVTIGNGKTAIIGFTNFTALRVTADA